MGEVNPEESLEIGPGVFKRLGDCTGAELESAIRLIAQRRIDRAWIAEQGAGPDRGELNIARRFFANTSDTERDLIALVFLEDLGLRRSDLACRARRTERTARAE